MKAESTIKKEIRRLRALIDSPNTGDVEKRVAYAMETTLIWTVENVRYWPNRVEECKATAQLICQEFERNQQEFLRDA